MLEYAPSMLEHIPSILEHARLENVEQRASLERALANFYFYGICLCAKKHTNKGEFGPPKIAPEVNFDPILWLKEKWGFNLGLNYHFGSRIYLIIKENAIFQLLVERLVEH